MIPDLNIQGLTFSAQGIPRFEVTVDHEDSGVFGDSSFCIVDVGHQHFHAFTNQPCPSDGLPLRDLEGTLTNRY